MLFCLATITRFASTIWCILRSKLDLIDRFRHVITD